MKKIISAVLVTLLSVGMFSGCTGARSYLKDVYEGYENLAQNSVSYDVNMKQMRTFGIKENKNNITVDLGKECAFNTITLTENGSSVTKFSIYASNKKEDDYKFIFQGDTVSAGRVCYVGDMTYRYLRIIVVESSKEDFSISNIGVYNNNKSATAKNLRVNSYLVASSITAESDFSMLEGITDIIFFGIACLNEKGDIYFADDNGEVQESVYAEKLNILKSNIAKSGKDINIVVDIHLPYGDDNAKIKEMMSQNLDNTIKNITDFVEKYDFDGYDIDYEYPYKSKEWKLYNQFLRRIKQAMPNKILSLATAGWAMKFDKDVIPLIDRVELMVYDDFDSHGYHASFTSVLNNVEKALDKGFSPSQIDLGVPFYSRPLNGHTYWGSYAQFAEQLGKYDNIAYYNGFDHQGKPMASPQYFNSYQTIADKTAFAIDANLGGLMIWHMSCDLNYKNELSLFRAINQTKQAKQA